MSTFGERLKALRHEKGVSARSLEVTYGLDRSSLRQIENGSRPPSAQDIEKLISCERLGLNMDTVNAWRRLDGISSGEVLEMLRTLANESDLLKCINQVLVEKSQPPASFPKES